MRMFAGPHHSKPILAKEDSLLDVERMKQDCDEANFRNR